MKPPAAHLLPPATPEWKMQPVPIRSRWATAVTPTNAWPEYPRPQMVRPAWQNLNGLWEYAITRRGAQAPERYDGHILVPYPLESALSGVKKSLQPDQLLWYRRTIDVAPAESGERVLVHFGAVDCEATVYLNGRLVGVHHGGYQSFTVDISNAVQARANEFIVKVSDPTEKGPGAHGKQRSHACWMFYTPSSGIWQTVWLERVPSTYIAALKLTPDVDRSALHLEVDLRGERHGLTVEAVVKSGQRIVARQTSPGTDTLQIERPRLWSPEDPYLYDLNVRVLNGGEVVDEVTSYFGLRKIEVKADGEGRARIYLNNRCTYNLGVVDQGYWPEGLYTAPSDAALRFDVQAIKALGFNTVRKHIKIEPDRWYYHCDRLGLMVWQDMPSANNDTPQARFQFEQEIKANLAQLHNHPSITTWVLFNEGWGAYDPERLARWIAAADPSRLVNGHSGPYDQLQHAQLLKRIEPSRLLHQLGGPAFSVDDLQRTQYQAPASWMHGDMADIHIYPGPEMFPSRADMATVTGEHGSFGIYIEGHVWDELAPVGIGVGASRLTPQQMLAAYADSIASLRALEAQGLSGSSYFQIVDVEGEHQGFLTYDRAIAKVPVAEIARLNAQLVPRGENHERATEGFFVEQVQATADSQRYEVLVEQFRSGQRDAEFLASLALTAQRRGDSPRASQALDDFIACAPQPYTRETWQRIIGLIHSSAGKAFELLRARSEEANAHLGAQAAEKMLLEIIGREHIVPYFTDAQRKMDWPQFEQALAEQHGVLGREAVLGAQMMDSLTKADWAVFGACYLRYFATAIPRSPYPLHSLSYRVLEHVSDYKVLEAAIRVMTWQIAADRQYPVFGRYDPTELDTYANLLHKVGRQDEALEWQERAVVLCDGRDPEIVANLQRMRSEISSRTTARHSESPLRRAE